MPKRNCKYPFKSDFYTIDEVFEDAECPPRTGTADFLMRHGETHAFQMSADAYRECVLARLLLRKRHDLYRPSTQPHEDFKHMTINIKNY